MNSNYFELICDKNLDYIDDLINYLNSNIEEIMDYFNLNDIKDKKKIVIWTDLNKYIKHIEQYTEYEDYMCADTFDGNMNMLSLEEAHKTNEHANMKVNELIQNVKHEFVHICQQECEKESISDDIAWFWEALATNLGNPEQFSKIDISDITIDQLNNFNKLNNAYPISFTLGKYMLENYTHDEILEYVKYPKKLERDQYNILSAAKEENMINNTMSI